MMYPRSVQYAIRALAVLARRARHEFLPVQDVARSSGVPQPYLAKIIQALVRAGLVVSQKGPGGGVALGRPAAAVTLEDVLLAVGGHDHASQCVLGLPRCSDSTPCPVHDIWKGVRATLQRRLHDRTLADITPARTPRLRRVRGAKPGARKPAAER